MLYCGIGVSAATLAVAVQPEDGCGFEQREFANTGAGHRQLVVWLGKRGTLARVSLEATGIYSLDVTLALDLAGGIEVAVLNPRTARRFAETLRRSKTDAAKRLLRLRREAMAAIAKDAGFQRKFEQLTGITGIGAISAVQLLGELAGLDPEMTVRPWVARSGLDPVHEISGTSVRKRSKISRRGSRHLRRALYLPALSATRFDPYMKAFYTQLQARHKTKLQALTAVARKLLHAIFGIFKTGAAYNGAKLFPQLTPTS